jgi:hypothetical protein
MKNVMLQLCENLSQKYSLELSIVQKENFHKQWDSPGRVKLAGLEFLVKGFINGFINSRMGKRRGRDGEEGCVDFISLRRSLSVCN